MRIAILLVAISACTLAVPVKELSLRQRLESSDEITRNSAIIDLINELFETIRDVMINGSGVIPPLDPLYVDRVNLDGAIIGMPDMYISLESNSLRGLSTFEAVELTSSSSLLRYTVNFNVKIPSVDVATEKYAMNLKVFGGNIFGEGDMKLKIVNPRVRGSVVVGIRLGWGAAYLTIHDCNVFIGIDSFEPTITGMFGNQVSSDFMSEYLKNLIPEMLDFFEADISNAINTAVMTFGNAILDDLNLIDIIGDLLP